jgi:tripartite-type tricarboxylate transporter receptor subunit TctC
MSFGTTSMLFRAAMIAVATGVLASGAAAQQRYPEKPVRLVVPYAPGGGTDILARVLSPKVSESLGQTLVVENRPGAGGNIGAEAVAKAAPDGYTLVMGANTIAINAGLGKLPFDPVKDFAPVTMLASAPMVVVVHPSVNARTLKELIALAKANPGTLNFSTPGNGTPQHLAEELLNRMAGVNIQHVLYKGGGPALTDIVAGQTQVAVLTMGSVKPYVDQGKLRALAVATARRSKAMPDVPTVAEAGVPGYEADLWYGIFAPAGTPPEVIARLNADFGKALAAPEVQERLAVQGFEIAPSTPEQLGAIHRGDIDKYGRLIREAGIKAEQ